MRQNLRNTKRRLRRNNDKRAKEMLWFINDGHEAGGALKKWGSR